MNLLWSHTIQFVISFHLLMESKCQLLLIAGQMLDWKEIDLLHES